LTIFDNFEGTLEIVKAALSARLSADRIVRILSNKDERYLPALL
jgi:hypothetical protein